VTPRAAEDVLRTIEGDLAERAAAVREGWCVTTSESALNLLHPRGMVRDVGACTMAPRWAVYVLRASGHSEAVLDAVAANAEHVAAVSALLPLVRVPLIGTELPGTVRARAVRELLLALGYEL